MKQKKAKSNIGTVYLIHFDDPFYHAKHYLGFTEDLVSVRLASHKEGSGSKLLAAVVAEGISFKVVRTWQNVDRNFERELKNKKNSCRICPVCTPGKGN